MGAKGTGDTQFQICPDGLVVDNHNIMSLFGKVKMIMFKCLLQKDNSCVNGGTTGSDDKQFNEPRGITVDNDDNIFVVDKGNNRIQMFSSEGEFIYKCDSFVFFPSL